MQKIGIYGGSFNPVQNAHLLIAELFCESMDLDKCIFIPASVSPFKSEDDYSEISDNDRLKMLEMAIEDNPKFEADDFELTKGGVSYSINTIDHLIKKYPESAFYLLIGGDHAGVFTDWKDWQEILKKTYLCIAQRPDTFSEDDKKEIEEKLTVDNKKLLWLDTPLIEISSTEIRKRAAENKTIRYMVPKKVEQYIGSHNLYK